MGKPGFIIPYRGFFVNRFHAFIYKIFLIIETLNYKHYSSAQASLPTDAGKRPGCHSRQKLGNPALPFAKSPYPCVLFVSLCYIVLLSPKTVLQNFWRHRCAVRNCVRCSIITNQREKEEVYLWNKKEYIKLEARIVALPMKENIAASGVPVPPDIPDHGDVFVGDDDVFEND